MRERATSEAEQLAFFDMVYARFQEAAARTKEVEYDVAVAGTVVRLAFAGPSLAALLTRAMSHLIVERVEAPDATIALWDSRSSGVGMLPPPCEPDRFTDRGDLRGFGGERIKIACHYHDSSLHLFDRERRTGIFWVNDAELIPSATRAAPLRTLLHWWIEQNGGQLVHAAAVGDGERALLLVGRGGLGKTSTALACLNEGLDFLGDDSVIVRASPSPSVYSLYATARLHPADLGRFAWLEPHLHQQGIEESEKAVAFLEPAFHDRIRREMPIHAVAIPHVANRAETIFVREVASELEAAAIFPTLTQLPYAGRHTQDFLAALCRRLPGYRVELGRDGAELGRAVLHFLRSQSHVSDDRPQTECSPRQLSMQVDSPLVSVIVPVYNGSSFVADALRSVQSQEYPSIEVFVVDDGSTDGTETIVRGLSPEVRYVRQDNRGPAAARNRGLREAAGEYVAFLDADDLWAEGALTALMKEHLASSALDVAQGHAQVTEYSPETGAYEYRGSPAESFPYSIASSVYRKRVFERVGLFDETLRFGEDLDWFRRAQEAGVAMKRLDLISLIVRRHGGNMTESKSLSELNLFRVIKTSLDRKRASESPLADVDTP